MGDWNSDMQVPRRILRWLQVGTALLAVPACAGPSSRPMVAGHALQRTDRTTIGAKPIRPGTELGMLYVYLANMSKSTVVIRGIRIAGPGIGTVAKVARIAIAPLRFGYHTYELHSSPGGLYDEEPPVFFAGNKCRRQALFNVRGYQMTPGSQARIWLVIRATHPGKWIIPEHTVVYSVRGRLYKQRIPDRAWGTVRDSARYIAVDWGEQKCIRPTGARLLRGYHLGR